VVTEERGFDNGTREARMERRIARALLWGGLLGGFLMLLGVILYAVNGGFAGHLSEIQRLTRPGRVSHPPTVFVSLPEIVHGLGARPVDPLAIIALGLVLLLATPVLGVAVAIPSFAREGDRRYAAIATFVLSMLLISAFLAGGAG
jgi:uncharacterized membrane protein